MRDYRYPSESGKTQHQRPAGLSQGDGRNRGMSEVADLTTVDHWGGCPKCLSHDGYLNLDREHWFKCDSHRVRWLVGSNLFSSWRFESQADWWRNGDRLAGYRIVEPVSAF